MPKQIKQEGQMNTEEVKKILKKYFSDSIGVESGDDIAKEICQLFPQPLEGRLLTRKEVDKVTSVKFSDEAWEDVEKALKAQLGKLPQPLDDEGLRGGVGRILLEYKEGELFLTEAIAQILALLQPKIEEELRIGNKLTATLTDKCRELESQIEEATKKERERILGDKLSIHIADKEVLVNVGEWAECQDVGVFVYFPYDTYWQALSGKGGEPR